MELRIYQYNNYYNRILKRGETLLDYPDEIAKIESVNFNPNDGITTTQVINYSGQAADYSLVIDDNEQIISRWFIIESKRVRDGQYMLSLYRDVLADFKSPILQAPCFIEKASLPISSPLIFNKENMSFNQIKKGEHLLKDDSRSAWITVYLAKEADTSIPTSFSVPQTTSLVDYDLTSLDNYKYYDYSTTAVNSKAFHGNYTSFMWGAKLYYIEHGIFEFYSRGKAIYFDGDGKYKTFLYDSSPEGDPEGFWLEEDTFIDTPKPLAAAQNAALGFTNWISYSYAYTNAHTDSELQDFLQEQGKIIYDGTNHYRIQIKKIPSTITNIPIPINSGYGLQIKEVFKHIPGIMIDQIYGTPCQIIYSCPTYKIQFEQISLPEITLTLPDGRNKCQDTVFEVIQMPVNDLYQRTTSIPVTVEKICIGDIAKRIAARIGLQPDTVIYDIQLLPYCPIDAFETQSWVGPGIEYQNDLPGIIDLTKLSNLRENIDYTWITDSNNNKVSIAFFLSTNSFSKTIYNPVSFMTKATAAIDKKINSECTMCRLVGPNFNGSFQFNKEKIGATNFYNIYGTLKPYNPYLYIAPDFTDSLYGDNYSDNRGLILAGDFSLPRVIDQWLNYQLNNKNYQQIFDRQKQNMEVTQDIQREKEKSQQIFGTVQAGINGGMSGYMISGGNPFAAAAGATVGSVASYSAGLKDIELNERLRAEAIDYTKDNFGYQLENIQALPHILTRIGAFDITNKIFPFLEFYDCTETEKEALRHKLRYNGMSVGVIGRIADYLSPLGEESYIKGQIIRIEDIGEDTHVVNQISNEIYKGVFI